MAQHFAVSAARLAAALTFAFLHLCTPPAAAQLTALTRQAQLFRQYNEPGDFVVLRSKDRFICEPGVAWTRTRPLWIHCDEADPPLAAIVLARNAKGDSVHGTRLSNIKITGRCKVAGIVCLAHEGPLFDNVIVDLSTPEGPTGRGGADVAGIIFSSVDLWGLNVPAGTTMTGATLLNTHVYNWWGGDSVDVLFAGECTDINWNGFQSTGKGLARVRAHAVPEYDWSNGKGHSAGVPKRINFSHAGMAEGTFAHNFVRTRDPAQPSFAQDITFAGVSWQAHDIQPIGGGPSGGGTDEPDGPPPPPSTSLMPIGIPEPGWSLWKSAEDGFVAPPANMWVDNTNATATDAGNPRGSATRPRRTIPYRLSAGDVLEIRGGPYTGNNLEMLATGTEQQPVIVRGVGLPRIEFKVSLFSRVEASRWVRFEGLDCYKWEAISANHHIVFRDSKLRNGGGLNLAGSAELGPVYDVVIANCEIHDNGNWLAEFDEDIHGGAIGARVNNVWIVGNRFWHNSGDSVQIEAGSAASQDTTHHIYVVGNEMREEKQTGGVVKRGRFVVFAGNHVHDMRPIGNSPSAWGAGLGHQYGAGPVWYNGNHLHNCSFGIQSGSTSGMGTGQDAYYLFNVIHDIRHDATIDPDTGKLKYAYNPNTAWSNAGFSLVGNPNKYVIGNTIINADGGIYFVGGVRLLAEGNIIAGNSNQDVWLEDPTGATLEVFSNLAWPSAELRIANQAQPWPIGNLVRDPMLGPNFKPLPGSPAIAAWTPSISARAVFQCYRDTFGVSIEVDATGSARPQGAWTIGAFQP